MKNLKQKHPQYYQNISVFFGLHTNTSPFRVGALNESSNVARLGMKSDKFVTIPRKLFNSVT